MEKNSQWSKVFKLTCWHLEKGAGGEILFTLKLYR